MKVTKHLIAKVVDVLNKLKKIISTTKLAIETAYLSVTDFLLVAKWNC